MTRTIFHTVLILGTVMIFFALFKKVTKTYLSRSQVTAQSVGKRSVDSSQNFQADLNQGSIQRTWKPGEYQVIHTGLRGVLGVRINKTKILSPYSEIHWKKCSRGEQKVCLALSNGASIEWSEQLWQAFPTSLVRGHLGHYENPPPPNRGE